MGGQEDKTDYEEEGSFRHCASDGLDRAESNFESGPGGQRGPRHPPSRWRRGPLKVGDSGKGSWFWRYRFAGRRREIGLGSRDRVTLVEARDAAKDQDALRRKTSTRLSSVVLSGRMLPSKLAPRSPSPSVR